MCTVTDRALLGVLACFCSHMVAVCHLLRTHSGRSPGAGNGTPLQYSWASLVAQTVKNPPAMLETWVLSLSWEDPLEEGMATHSSILAWRIPTDRAAWWATVHGVAKSQT